MASTFVVPLADLRDHARLVDLHRSRGLQRRQIRRGAAPPAGSPEVVHDGSYGGLRGRAGVGGRRRTKRLGVAGDQVPGAASHRPEKGAVGAGASPTARMRHSVARRAHRDGSGIGHRRGERTPGPSPRWRATSPCWCPRPRKWGSRTSTGRSRTGSSWPTPDGAGRGRRGPARCHVRRFPRIEHRGHVVGADDPGPRVGLDRGGRARPSRA